MEKPIRDEPAKKWRAGVITLSMWENKFEDKIINSFTMQKSYKDKNDEWQNKGSFNLYDLPKLTSLMDVAFTEQIMERKKYEDPDNLETTDIDKLKKQIEELKKKNDIR